MNKPIWTIHQINKEDELNKPITKETVMLEKFPLRNLLPKYIFFWPSTTNSFIIELMVQNIELLILVFSKHTINSSVLSVFE